MAGDDVSDSERAAEVAGSGEGRAMELRRRSPEDQIKYLEDRIVELVAVTPGIERSLKADVEELEAENATLARMTQDANAERDALQARVDLLTAATVGECGNASPGNGRYHPCGIQNHCTLPAGHAGWHQQDHTRWGKPWSDDDADGRAVDAVTETLKLAADKLDRQAEAHNESIVDYTDLLRVWADDNTRWGQGR